MKTKLIIFFLLLSLSLNAQDYFDLIYPEFHPRLNTIYVSVQPVDKGIGFRYDYFFNQYGTYLALNNKQEFIWADLYSHNKSYIKDHLKVAGGFLFKIPEHNPQEYQTFFGVGLTYNHYGQNNIPLNSPILNTWSFEISVNAKMLDRFNVGIRYDLIKAESSVDFGISF